MFGSWKRMPSPHKTDMLRAPIVATFFRYSLPWTLSFLFMSSAGIVDGIFVGRYIGSMALAAINIVWPIFSLFFGVGIAIASGSSVRCAAYLAHRQHEEANAIFTKSHVAVAIFGILFTMPCAITPEIVAGLLGADATLMPYAVTYLRTASYFFPIMLLTFLLSYFLRVDERPNLAASGLIVTAFVNMILDYLFIAQWNMGLLGAALATGFGYSSAGIIFIVGYFFSKKSRRLYFTKVIGAWSEIFKAMWNGISEMINEISTGTVIILINITMMQLIGAKGVAAFTVVSYINWFCLVLCFGLSDSLSPLVSANHACKLYRRSESLLQTASISVFCIGLLCFFVVSFMPHYLIDLFLPSAKESANIALDFMYYSRFMFLFCGINIVLTSYFTGRMQAACSGIVALLRTLVLPMIFLIALPPFFGYTGIALSLPLSEALTFIVAFYLLKRTNKAYIRR